MQSKDDGSDEEEEVLLEPRFTYSRVLNNVPMLLGKDKSSCFAVHDKFIAIGTQSGYIYIMDHMGHVHEESTARHHRCAVSGISVDTAGSYLASCANDARVSLYGIGSEQFTQTVDLKSAVRCVAISPDFSRRGSRQMFVTAEKDLTLYERRFFSTHKNTLLYQGLERDGFIHTVSWREPLIAFTNDTGTRIYDRGDERMLALVQPIHEPNANSVLCCHRWLNHHTLVVGWCNTVSVCVILPATNDLSSVSSTESGRNKEKTGSMRKVEVHFAWRLDVQVVGLSFTLSQPQSDDWKEIVVLGMKQSSEQEDVCMQLSLLEPDGVQSFVLNTEDRIEMRSCCMSQLSHFHLEGLPLESVYFLLGPEELIQAEPCSSDERVRWYMENGLLKQAVQYGIEHHSQLKQYNSLHVGKAYLDSLINQRRFHEAAANLPLVCAKHKDQWEYYVNEFERNNVLLQLAKYLPVKDPQLEPESYQSVLLAALYNHPVLFHGLIKAWSPDLYRVGAIIEMAMKRIVQDVTSLPLSAQHIACIYRALAILHTHERKYDKALMLYIRLNDKTVFQVIERYNLFGLVKNNISKLMEVDADLAIRLLIENASSLPARTVLSQVSKYPKLQMAYLNRLFERNEGDDFANLAIRLYAEHDPAKLLPFLRKKQCYDMTKALHICESKEYIKEMVFLLGRSGNYSKALDLLLNKLGRLEVAIAFCTENDDRRLWDELIAWSVNRPQRISQLLNIAGEHISPIEVVNKIPERMVIPGLRDSLTKIVRDFELQLQMQAGCRAVLLDTSDSTLNAFLSQCSRPVLIAQDAVCVSCSTELALSNEAVIVFGCEHGLHQSCLSDHPDTQVIDSLVCPNCTHQPIKQ